MCNLGVAEFTLALSATPKCRWGCGALGLSLMAALNASSASYGLPISHRTTPRLLWAFAKDGLSAMASRYAVSASSSLPKLTRATPWLNELRRYPA